jgi:hypothetical protein
MLLGIGNLFHEWQSVVESYSGLSYMNIAPHFSYRAVRDAKQDLDGVEPLRDASLEASCRSDQCLDGTEQFLVFSHARFAAI